MTFQAVAAVQPTAVSSSGGPCQRLIILLI